VLDAEVGDTIITPAGVQHSFEVLDGKPAQVVCGSAIVFTDPVSGANAET
jgi:hypothetical protein